MGVRSRGRPLEEGMATPVFLTGESHGQRSLARHDWNDLARAHQGVGGWGGWGHTACSFACCPTTDLPLFLVFSKHRHQDRANLMCTSMYLCRRTGRRRPYSFRQSRLEVRRTRLESLISPPTSCILNLSRSQYSQLSYFSTHPHWAVWGLKKTTHERNSYATNSLQLLSNEFINLAKERKDHILIWVKTKFLESHFKKKEH